MLIRYALGPAFAAYEALAAIAAALIVLYAVFGVLPS